MAGKGRRGHPSRGGCGRHRSHRQRAWLARARSRCRCAPTLPSPSRCPPPSHLSAHHTCQCIISQRDAIKLLGAWQTLASPAGNSAAKAHACRWGVRLATTCLHASMTAAAVDSLAVLLQLGPARKAGRWSERRHVPALPGLLSGDASKVLHTAEKQQDKVRASVGDDVGGGVGDADEGHGQRALLRRQQLPQLVRRHLRQDHRCQPCYKTKLLAVKCM